MTKQKPAFYFGIGILLTLIFLVAKGFEVKWLDVILYIFCGILGVIVTIVINKWQRNKNPGNRRVEHGSK